MLRSHTLALTASVSIFFTIAAGCHTTYVRSSPSPSPGPSYEHAPEPHGPAHESHHKFTYVHYPSCNVYHDRERKLWFWIEGRDWKMGVELPARYRVTEHEAVTVELETDSPCEAKPLAPPEKIVDHGPPAHAPAHGYHRKFAYVHYPSTNVYCDRERHLWFWFEGSEWRKGATLPTRFRVDNHEAVKVELEDETPYEHARSHTVQAHDSSEKVTGDERRDAPGHGRNTDKSKGNDEESGHGNAKSHGQSNKVGNTGGDAQGDVEDKGPSNSENKGQSSSENKGQGSSEKKDKKDVESQGKPHKKSDGDAKGSSDNAGKSQGNGQAGAPTEDKPASPSTNTKKDPGNGSSKGKTKGQAPSAEPSKGESKGKGQDKSKDEKDKDDGKGKEDVQGKGKDKDKDG